MNRPFLFLSVLTSSSEDNVPSLGNDAAAETRPVTLTTTDGTTASVRIESFELDALKVSYDDGRVRRVDYGSIDVIERRQSNGRIKIIAVGGELAILTNPGAADSGNPAEVH